MSNLETKHLLVVLVIGISLGFALSITFSSFTGLFISRSVDQAAVQPIFSPGSQPAFVDAVRQARGSIELEVYTFTSTVLRDELASAVSRGVDVKVILERSIDTNLPMSRELLSRGVKVKFGSRSFERTHSKFLIIDNETVFVGSNNWTFHSFNLNREAGVAITDANVAGDFLAVFYADWSGGVAAT